MYTGIFVLFCIYVRHHCIINIIFRFFFIERLKFQMLTFLFKGILIHSDRKNIFRKFKKYI
jgi:hypothetical protein